MRKDFIKQINKEFYDLNKDKYKFLHCGFFNNNHILILGMCPGNPWDKYQQELVDSISTDSNYESREKKYYNIIKNTKITEYLDRIFSSNWSHLCFTNLVKCPTVNNEEPSEELLKEFKDFTNKQITITNPNLVVCLGKWVGSKYGLTSFYEFKKKNDIYYTMIPHPSYWDREGKPEDLIIVIKHHLNTFFKKHAIINVNQWSIYYRDEEFRKLKYVNDELDNFCFIRSDDKTEYRSYDGYYLKKIDKYEYPKGSSNTYEQHLNRKDLFYYNNIYNISHSKIIRYMAFDLENDYSKDVINTPRPITSITYFDNLENKKHVFVLKHNIAQSITVKDKDDLKIYVYDNEKMMISDFLEHVKDYDCLTGWYSSQFDIVYLFNRCDKLNINLNEYFDNLWGLETDNFHIMCDSHIFHDALLMYQKTIYFNKPPSYSLDAVSKFLFGDLLGGKAKHLPLDVIWKEDINNLILYNVRDVELLQMIIEHAQLIEYPLLLQRFCPQDFENAFYNSKTIENLLHHRYWNKKIYFPTKIEHEKKDFTGAFVLNPVADIHSNVVAFDFSSQYTNIYISFNFSPDTLIGEKSWVENNIEFVKKDLILRYPELKEKITEDFLKQCILIQNDFGEHYFLPKNFKVGVLPELESEMLNLRKIYTDLRDSFSPESKEYKMADDNQGLAKTIINSIYGVTGYYKFILNNPIVSSSITSIGRQISTWIQDRVKEKQAIPIYSDTDSLFICLGKSDLNTIQCIEACENMNSYINESLKNFMQKFTSNDFVINNHTNKIEFEKIYNKLMMSCISRTLKKSQTVKKRYFGYLKYYKGKILEIPKLQVVGFETRKESTPIYFRDVLLNIYKMFLEDNYKSKILDYYNFIKKDIKNQKIEDLLIKMKLSRDLDSYKKTIPIHVRACKNSNSIVKRAEYVNMVFVKDSREVIHYDEMNLDKNIRVDYDKYIEKMFIDKIKLIDDTIVLDDNRKLNEFLFSK